MSLSMIDVSSDIKGVINILNSFKNDASWSFVVIVALGEGFSYVLLVGSTLFCCSG